MTFYQELKEFFSKNDPDRLYMAKKIFNIFRKKNQQKVVLKRLEIIYKNGGPANIELEPKEEPIAIEEETVVTNEAVEQEVNDENATPQDIIIETEDDDDVNGEA